MSLYDYVLTEYNNQFSSYSYYIPTISCPSVDTAVSSEFKLIYSTKSFNSAFDNSMQKIITGHAQWTAVIEMAILDNIMGLEWETFFTKLNGTAGKFILYDPQQTSVNKSTVADSGIYFDDNTNFTDNTEFESSFYEAVIYSADTSYKSVICTIAPTPADFFTLLRAGQKITIQTLSVDNLIGYELKTLTSDVIVNPATSRAIFNFEPPLRNPAKINGDVFFVKPFGFFNLQTDDSFSLLTDYNNTYKISFSVVEAI